MKGATPRFRSAHLSLDFPPKKEPGRLTGRVAVLSNYVLGPGSFRLLALRICVDGLSFARICKEDADYRQKVWQVKEWRTKIGSLWGFNMVSQLGY